jgi:hypothetical protein
MANPFVMLAARPLIPDATLSYSSQLPFPCDQELVERKSRRPLVATATTLIIPRHGDVLMAIYINPIPDNAYLEVNNTRLPLRRREVNGRMLLVPPCPLILKWIPFSPIIFCAPQLAPPAPAVAHLSMLYFMEFRHDAWFEKTQRFAWTLHDGACGMNYSVDFPSGPHFIYRQRQQQ